MAKADPFSIRLGTEDDRFVTAEARRLKRSRGSILAEYAAEGIRTRRYPGIAFRGEDHRRRAWVLGTGLDVWELVSLLRDFEDERTVANEYDLTLGQIRIASAYAREFGDEIDALIEENRSLEHDLRRRYPFIQTLDEVAGGSG